mmetsp:Transcript_4322/g.10626  ORF Transcript_4322/g.10626 Transcript_4322/m.10626 type:complete len:137 (+) Transcript_4322:56-466(+)
MLGDQPLSEQLDALEDATRRLVNDLNAILDGVQDLRESTKSTEASTGVASADKMRREVSDVFRMQTAALRDMDRSVQDFPRRWARFELHTSQRKTLMLNIKARRKQAAGDTEVSAEQQLPGTEEPSINVGHVVSHA